MGQVTSRLSDELEAALNRWAAEDGVQRSDLIRQILGEATDARREGRATFQRPEQPGPADLSRLVAKLDTQTTEIDRVLRQNAKRDAELARHARDDTRGVSEARDAIVADVIAQMRAALELVHGELVHTREELAALMQRLPQLVGIDGKLDRVLEAAQAPKVSKTYNIGLGNWSGGMLAMAGVIVLVFGMFAFVALAAILPERWLELRMANRMLGGGDRAICRLVDYHYGTGLTNCSTAVTGRTVTVTATAPRGGAAR